MPAGDTAGAGAEAAGWGEMDVALGRSSSFDFDLSMRSAQLHTAGSDPPIHAMSNSSRPRSARRDAHTAACASAIVLNGTAAVACLGGLCAAFLGGLMESTIESPSTGPKLVLMKSRSASVVVRCGYLASGYLRRTVVSCSPGKRRAGVSVGLIR